MTTYANKKRLKGPTLEEGDKIYLLRKTSKPSYGSGRVLEIAGKLVVTGVISAASIYM
jgi:hypothetical protein